MFDFLSFNFLLKLIYKVAKFSGFFYVSIGFNSAGKAEIQRTFSNVFVFIISLGLSLASNFFDSRLPFAHVTHSKLLEICVNLSISFTTWTSCVLKLHVHVQRNKIFEILSNLQWGERNVNQNLLKPYLFRAFEVFTSRCSYNVTTWRLAQSLSSG